MSGGGLAHIPRGLEWLPAPSPSSSPSSSPPRPLVIILPWMWAARASVAKQAALYHGLGCDVAVYRWPVLAVWVPALARWNAASLLTALARLLEREPGRPVLLACFSGAAKGVLCPLLDRLTAAAAAASPEPGPGPSPHTPAAPYDGSSTSAGLPSSSSPSGRAPAASAGSSPAPARRPDPAAAALLARLRGVLFDSGPVDFDSSVGVRLFATARHPAVRKMQAAAGAAAAGTLDFLLFEAFEAQRRAMWVGLRGGLAGLRLPVAFLYSWRGDKLADPQPIHALAEALRRGGEVALGFGEVTSGGGSGGRSGCECPPGGQQEGAGAGAGGGVAGTSSSGSSGQSPSPGPFSLAFWRARVLNGMGGGSPPQTPPPPPPAVVAAPVPVQEQAWDSSGHVAHLREHPGDYRAAVAAFLQRCLGGDTAGPTEAPLETAPLSRQRCPGEDAVPAAPASAGTAGAPAAPAAPPAVGVAFLRHGLDSETAPAAPVWVPGAAVGDPGAAGAAGETGLRVAAPPPPVDACAPHATQSMACEQRAASPVGAVVVPAVGAAPGATVGDGG